MPRLLLAEDSPTQALQIRAILENAGYEVVTAANGREALEQISQCLPDLVVTDLEMPEMNGLELVERVNRVRPSLPVVLVTGQGTQEIAVQALKKGAASYVPKHYLKQELVPVLDSLLAVTAKTEPGEHGSEPVREQQFCISNDHTLVPSVIARLQEDLNLVAFGDQTSVLHISTALDEALTNAIYHGNLEISSSLKDQENGHEIFLEMADKRRVAKPYSERKVLVSARTTMSNVTYTIRDEGPGFDRELIPDPTDPENLLKPCGRGLLLIHTFMDSVSHNEAGNEITMVKQCQAKPREDNETPTFGSRIEDRYGVIVAYINEDVRTLEHARLESLKEYLVSAIGPDSSIIVDVKQTDFIGTGFIQVLFAIWNRVSRQKGKFAITSVTPHLREVLRVTQLDKLWTTYESVDEALAAMDGN